MHRCGILKNQFLAYSWFSRPAHMSRSTRRAPGAMQDQTLPSSFESFATSYFSFQYVALTFPLSFLSSFTEPLSSYALYSSLHLGQRNRIAPYDLQPHKLL